MALEIDKMTRMPGDEAFRRESVKGTQWEPTYAGALSFMRRKYTRDLKGVDIAVTGIPFDQAVSHRPRAARRHAVWRRQSGSSASRRPGAARSLAATIGSIPPSGQSMPMSASFQRTPRSHALTHTSVVL